MVYGPFWQHVKEAWELRHHPNLHFVFYENLKNNTKEELQKLNDFLGTNLTDEQLENVGINQFMVNLQIQVYTDVVYHTPNVNL